MTRLNLVEPGDLTDRHLIAEYKEITQFLHIVAKRRDKGHPMDDLPKHYTLNNGHCKFFMNKGKYILERFDQLFNTLQARGFKVDADLYQERRSKIISSYSSSLMGSYSPKPADYKKAIARITERIQQKPELYPDKDRFFSAIRRYEE